MLYKIKCGCPSVELGCVKVQTTVLGLWFCKTEQLSDSTTQSRPNFKTYRLIVVLA